MNTNTKLNAIVSEIKHSWNLALPLVVSFIVQQLTPFFGTMMIARLGVETLDAQALGLSIYRVLIVFFFSIFGSVNILISQSFGAKNHQGVQRAVLGSFQLGVILSLIVMVFMWVSPYVLYFSTQSQSTIRLGILYAQLSSIYVLPMALLFVIERFLISIQQSRLVLWISIIQGPFEILALYCFIFGKLGLPPLGLIGSVYAYFFVFVLADLVLIIFLARSQTTKIYHLFSRFWWFRWSEIKELYRLGWPLGIASTLEVGMFAVLTLMMSWLSSIELASYQISNQFSSLLLMFLFALTQTTTIRVGQAVGMKNKELIKLTTGVNIFITISCITLVSIILMTFLHQIIQIDVKPYEPHYAELLHYSSLFLFITVVSMLIEAFRFNIIGSLRGMKDTRFLMYASFVGMWVIGLPLAYLFAFTLHYQGVGLLTGELVGIGVGAFMVWKRFRRLLSSDIKYSASS